MRPMPIVGALAGAAVLTLAPAASALAEPPVTFSGAYVVDAAGVLPAGTGRIESALDDLYERAGVSLFVVYVDTFDDPSDPGLWSDTTAALNGLGPDDVLLSIAVGDRQYQISDEVLSDSQYDAVATRVESLLRADDWEGAAVEAADAIADELAGADTPPPPTGDSGGGIPILPIAIGAGVVGLGVWGYSRFRKSRRGADPSTPVEKLDQKQLDLRAGTLLVQLDDALQSNEQELGFAQAQFGEAATKGFSAALAAARGKVGEAFAIRQQLDDATPETADDKRKLTTRIIALCEEAAAALEAESDAFEELRQLETHAPEVLEKVATTHAGLPARIDAAAATIADLARTFGDPATTSVADAPARSRELVTFAATAIGEARTALAAGDTAQGAVAVRGAQQAVDQVERALAAVDALAAGLPAAVERLAAATAHARADIAEAQAGLASASPAIASPLRAAVEDAERVLAGAEKKDPTTAIGEVERVNAALQTALGPLRDAQAQAKAAEAQLGRVTTEAQAAVAAARDFIATRRGAVGATARTRVAEAERQLTQALSLRRSDPVEALRSAQQAVALAGAAMQSAQSDVAAFNGGSYGPPSSGYGSAVLGGLLGGMLSGSSPSGWFSSGSSGWSGGSSSAAPRPRPRPRPRPSGSTSRPRPSSGRRSRGGRF